MSSYKKAGVDIDAGNAAEGLIARAVKKTYNKSVLSGVGGFGAVYSLASLRKMKNPVLVSTADGVGTKLKVAAMMNKWDSVGKDIVNHCSNDLLAMGAKPLFFLDYIAADKISPERVAQIVSGMAKACKEIGCALIGGETAEMPGVYVKGEHDIVGFMVGAAERKRLFDPKKIRKGDIMVALASNGLHTNGFSLAREALFSKGGLRHDSYINGLGCTLGEALLKPHKSYSRVVLALLEEAEVKGVAHITGGGLSENLPRILPKRLSAAIDYSSIKVPYIFRLIQEKGRIPEKEMFRAFNMGVGLVLVVSGKDAFKALHFLKKRGENAWMLGKIA